MKTSQSIIPRANTLLASVLLLMPATHATPEAATIEPEFHIPKVSPQPERLAQVATAKQAAVFSLGLVSPSGESIMNKMSMSCRISITVARVVCWFRAEILMAIKERTMP
jgi:hypothetical protein